MEGRAPAKTFRDLVVWQKAHQLTVAVYQFTSAFPKHEIYGLSSQMRRAAVSVAANIAEGFRKRSRTDKARFMDTSEGSLEECRYYLILAEDLHYGAAGTLMTLLDDVARLPNAYSRALLTPNS